MNEGTMSGLPKPINGTFKKLAIFSCATCVFVWVALGLAAVGLILVNVLK